MQASEPGPTFWIDVEDVFEYFRFNPHPSGIQRVAIEIARALIAEAPDRVRIVRHGAEPGQVREVAWADVETMLATPPTPETPADPGEDGPRRSRLQRAILRLPAELRDPLFRAGVLQSQVLRNLDTLIKAVRPPPPRELRLAPAGAALQGAGPAASDAYLVLGAPWSVPDAATHLAALHAQGVRTALLIHDLIPVRRPEWQRRAKTRSFRAWLEASLPASAVVLSLSRFTAQDVEAYAGRHGIALAGPVRAIGAGTSPPPAAAATVAGLPLPGSYVLFVSTLEARKNHALAVKVWQKLMAEVRAGTRAPETVPQLVFAGRVGLGVADVLQQMDNSRWLNGRIRLIRDPSDAELRALYDGCRFTLLPSLYEGWGLPLEESLALGKPCLAAGTTALPETGGDLCRYFDPEDVGAAYRAVAALLDDPGAVASWTEDVRRRFRPRDWRGPARALLDQFAALPA